MEGSSVDIRVVFRCFPAQYGELNPDCDVLDVDMDKGFVIF